MESSGKFDVGCDQESVLATPYTDWDCDTFVASMKEGSSSHSSSSWDLEPKSIISSAILDEGMSDSVTFVGEGLSECIKLKENYFDLEQQNEYGSYDELLKKFIEKEEELRVSNYKLEHCEEEVIKLKIQIEQSESQLNDVKKESKQKKVDLEQCEHQLEVANEQLKISGNEIERLTKELGCKSHETHELQGQLKVVEDCVDELSETNMDMISRLKEWEERSNACESKLRQCEAANLKLQKLHVAQQMTLQGEINSLKEMEKNELCFSVEHYKTRYLHLLRESIRP